MGRFLAGAGPILGHAIGGWAARAMATVYDNGDGQILAREWRGNQPVEPDGQIAELLICDPGLCQNALAQVEGHGLDRADDRGRGRLRDCAVGPLWP